jgi:hypothetical protein
MKLLKGWEPPNKSMQVTLFPSFGETTAAHHKDVTVALDRIKNGRSKELIEKIRDEKEPDKIKALKLGLPCVLFSGTFSKRNAMGLVQHSGLICLDLDKFPDYDTLKTWLDTIVSLEFCFAAWISPSGHGIKFLVKIPAEPANHKGFFYAIKDFLKCPYFDTGANDVSRICFESYDPNIYVNQESTIWTEKIEENRRQIESDQPYRAIFPLRDENRTLNIILAWWTSKFGLPDGKKNDHFFILAAALNDYGIDKAQAIESCVSLGDFGKGEEIRKVVVSAYKATEKHGTKQFEDRAAKKRIVRMVQSGKPAEEIMPEFPLHTPAEIEATIIEMEQSESITEFWRYNNQKRITLVNHRFKQFLEQNNFFKLYPEGSKNFVFVKVVDNFIEDTTTDLIKDFVLDYLYTGDFGLDPYDYMTGKTAFFKEDFLSLINTTTVSFKEDTAETAYLYYLNHAICVTEGEVEVIPYSTLGGYVWRKHIINRDYIQTDPTNCMFERFMRLIAGEDEGSYDSLRSVLGYLLHSYKNGKNNKAIILNDEVISDNPNGGSGKGIFCNAIGQMKRVATIDGKSFDHTKNFAYQTVQASTQVLVFDDVKRNFNFESLFSLVTEGITLEKKNKDAVKLPVNKSPKVVITTNYTIGGVGGSHERRKFEAELSSYFGSHHTPYDEFKQMLFDDWDVEEWSRFDNFMIQCLQLFLSKGLISCAFKSLETKKFQKETSIDFHEWVQDAGLPENVRFNPTPFYDQFTAEYPDERKFSQKRFSQWLDAYAKFKGGKTDRGSSNGQRWTELQIPKQETYINGKGESVSVPKFNLNEDVPF